MRKSKEKVKIEFVERGLFVAGINKIGMPDFI